jgi:cytochrome c
LVDTIVAAYAAALKGGMTVRLRCTRCHDLDTHGIGPAHRGVFGRLAGRAPGYDYSTGLKRASFRWNARTLDLWLADPDAFVTWQQMEFSVPEARDRADLIAYLRTLR